MGQDLPFLDPLGGPRGVTEVTEDTTRYSYLQIGEDTGRYGKLQNSIFNDYLPKKRT